MVDTDHLTEHWQEIAGSGLVAGIAFGLLIQFVVKAMPAVGALYGMPSVAAGWIAHLVHSIVFAFVFAAIVETDQFRAYTESIAHSAGIGAVFGAVVWAVAIVFVWPVWLASVGFPAAAQMSIPNIAMKPLVGHLVYGIVLGAGYSWSLNRS